MYGYEVWKSGSVMRDNGEYEYFTENEAMDEALDSIKDVIDGWKIEGVYDGETEDDFEIRILEL